MKTPWGRTVLPIFAITIASLVLMPAIGRAHCDGMDGPVVQAGRKALEQGDARLALAWVQPKDEAAIREAFGRTLAVRSLNPEARTLADSYFFETLVRLHRAGEGAPYTGLHPAGRDLGPAIPAADKAVAEGSVEPLLRLLNDQLQRGLRQRFQEVSHTRDFDKTDVEAGRAHVKAYVEFVHYVEGLYDASAASHERETHAPQP